MQNNIIPQYTTGNLQIAKKQTETFTKEYVHVFQKESDKGITFWECEFQKKEKYKGKLKLSVAGSFIEETNKHTNLSSAARCEGVKAKTNINRKTLKA